MMTTLAHTKSKLANLSRAMPDLKDYMTVQEAAKALGLHVETIREFLRDDTLQGLKVAKTWIVSKSSVETYKKKTSGMEKNDPRRKKKAS